MFDVAGRQTSWYSGYGDTYESRDYRPCVGRPHSFVSVDYENGRVSSKYAYRGLSYLDVARRGSLRRCANNSDLSS